MGPVWSRLGFVTTISAPGSTSDSILPLWASRLRDFFYEAAFVSKFHRKVM